MPENNYISTPTDRGTINISEDVFAVMVGAAIAEVEGVAGMASTVGSDLQELLGRKSLQKGVKVSFDENGTVVVDVLLTVRFGYNITQVAKQVQEKVASGVEAMTASHPVVNVHVAGVSFSSK